MRRFRLLHRLTSCSVGLPILIDVPRGSAKDDYAPRSAELALNPPLHEASGAVFIVESHFP
jgi:hypothetical protein